ncbi:MAG: hypothetical protein ACYDH6_10075 [Acidimicrobiales bacterium]
MASEFQLVDPPGLPAQFGDAGTVAVRPWTDDVIDTLGFDPRSAYVERFWLGILGPSTTWLLRRIATAFDESPAGFEMPLSVTAREIGLGDKGGRHSPFMRALWRCRQFDLARPIDDGLEVRRRVPPLSRRQIQRLPDALQEAHGAWQSARLGAAAADADRRRARALALTMLEIDPDAAAVEQRLVSWGVHPAVAGDAAHWAWERHAAALVSSCAPASRAET